MPLRYQSLWQWWQCHVDQTPPVYFIFDRPTPVQITIFSALNDIAQEQQSYWQAHVCTEMQNTQGGHATENANYLTPWKQMVQLIYTHMNHHNQ